jgi:bile acid:Na+ symporter, BASS family
MDSLKQLIPLVINASIFLVVFALGLKAEMRDAFQLLRQPGLLIRSILAMNVIMALFAVTFAAIFDLPAVIEITLIALALSPVPPILPNKQEKAGGSHSYAIGLLLAASFAAIVIAPLAVPLIAGLFGREAGVPPHQIAKVVLVSVFLPLLLGMAARAFLKEKAVRLARLLSTAGSALLVVAVLPVLFTATTLIWQLIGNGALVALAAFALTGLATGHVLGGPRAEDRTDLALATSTRHPGVALAIASLALPGEKAILAIVLYHLIIGAIVTLPYIRWRRRAGQPGQSQ